MNQASQKLALDLPPQLCPDEDSRRSDREEGKVGPAPHPGWLLAQQPVEAEAGGVIGRGGLPGQRLRVYGGRVWGQNSATAESCVLGGRRGHCEPECIDFNACQQAVRRE